MLSCGGLASRWLGFGLGGLAGFTAIFTGFSTVARSTFMRRTLTLFTLFIAIVPFVGWLESRNIELTSYLYHVENLLSLN